MLELAFLNKEALNKQFIKISSDIRYMYYFTSTFQEYEDEIDYPEDVDKIVDDFKQHGYEISRSDASNAWKEHSDGYAAGWLGGIVSIDTFNILKQYFIEEEQ